MKKLIAIVITLLICGGITVSAMEVAKDVSVKEKSTLETDDVNSSSEVVLLLLAQIEILTKQIQKMQLELDALQNSNNSVWKSNSTDIEVLNNEEEIVFSRTLNLGAEGEDVKKLQSFLANDKKIYPEGLVTGYFGALTEKAVSKYQEKNGLESVGVVGPKTRALINQKVYDITKNKAEVTTSSHTINSVEENSVSTSLQLYVADSGARLKWNIEGGDSFNPSIVLWSKEPMPTYPARAKDIWVYFEDGKSGEVELEAKDGVGNYYARICRLETKTNTCANYSNQIEIKLK